jgi:hypothetical protein
VLGSHARIPTFFHGPADYDKEIQNEHGEFKWDLMAAAMKRMMPNVP